MLIVLTGLQPTLWFADARTIETEYYSCRKFLFTRVVHDGKPLICAMCIVVGVCVRDNIRFSRGMEFSVRELGLGVTPIRYRQTVTGSRFENVRTAQAYAIRWALETLSRTQTRELLLHVANMYDESHYKNWEMVCL